MISQARTSFKNGETKECIDYLIKICNTDVFQCNSNKITIEGIRSDLDLLSNRFAKLQKDKYRGVKENGECNLEENKISIALLSYLEKLELLIVKTNKKPPDKINLHSDESDVSIKPKTKTTEIELTIKGDINSYSNKKKEELLRAIGILIELDSSEIKIKKMKSGSIKMTIEIPIDKKEKLLELISSGKMNSYNVISAKEVNKEQKKIIKQESSNESQLASNIRFLRKSLSLSQGDLAQKLNLNRGNIASYEKGTSEPKIVNLLNLSSYFQVSVIDLTTVNLQSPSALANAKENYRYELRAEDKVILEKFSEQAEELSKVINSINISMQFHKKQIIEVPNTYQFLFANYSQLDDVVSMQLKAHKELLGFIGSKI